MRIKSNMHLQKLSEITDVILSPLDNYLALKNSLDDLKELFIKISGLDMNADENSENLYLESGKAIGPRWAGMCIDDIMRTKRFICGIDKAIKDVRKNNDQQQLTILYAGTGPFATLVMPFIALYTSDELQFILLEVNLKSVNYLKTVINTFNAEDYIKAIHLCDASTFQLPEGTEADILLIECLQHALAREPQVAITYNLLPQLQENVILIPKEITLYIALIDSKKQNEFLLGNSENGKPDFYENSEAVFTINKEIVINTIGKNNTEDLKFDEVNVMFSETQLKPINILAVTTELCVYYDEILNINDSGLTIPLQFAHLDNEGIIKGVVTRYTLGDEPSLQTILIK